MTAFGPPTGPGPTSSTGVPDLDDLLGALVPGDNVVWSYDDVGLVSRFEDAFVREGLRRGEPCHYVTTSTSPAGIGDRFGPDVVVLDARPEKRYADLVRLEQTVLETARAAPGRFVVEGLESFARRQGAARALGLFTRTCPQLFDLGSVAYWRAPTRPLGASFVESLRRVTQCVIQLERGNLRVLKAEGHRARAEGQLVRVEAGDGPPQLSAERSLGRLASALRRIREQRHLTQAELANLAGVSPSAISQAEAAQRGLSLDTVMTLSERLQVSIDELLARARDVDYVLARRDRGGVPGMITPLLDDPHAGLRAYLVNLPAGEAGSPPMVHKGVELVVVASGLVQLELGAAAPVMRAGDAVLATRVAVEGWRNLAGEPARLFWVLRD
ncbi:MAG TPA: helix-turn-helix domain-containing protein [Acidimicrobiia bacterium]|jgi:transcriptional regulator with XRE-family HTH domain|nr:helix-turn-helix domain-containing protein [Acidimicrobiia bacterium]